MKGGDTWDLHSSARGEEECEKAGVQLKHLGREVVLLTPFWYALVLGHGAVGVIIY